MRKLLTLPVMAYSLTYALLTIFDERAKRSQRGHRPIFKIGTGDDKCRSLNESQIVNVPRTRLRACEIGWALAHEQQTNRGKPLVHETRYMFVAA
jgi:hypothetical protein